MLALRLTTNYSENVVSVLFKKINLVESRKDKSGKEISIKKPAFIN